MKAITLHRPYCFAIVSGRSVPRVMGVTGIRQVRRTTAPPVRYCTQCGGRIKPGEAWQVVWNGRRQNAERFCKNCMEASDSCRPIE